MNQASTIKVNNQQPGIRSQQNREWVILSYPGVNNTSCLTIDFSMKSFFGSCLLFVDPYK
ncbi:MAG: hypothetical protein JWP78_1404 [Mucilaginibacter sp.]|nr:hypothetical protein [Mucilaginibacter sp.]